MIWNASPRFFANADSAATESASAPAVIAPATADALKSAPVLPRWMRSSSSKPISSFGGEQIGRLPGDEAVVSDRVVEERRQSGRQRRIVAARERAERQVQQPERGEDRDRVAELEVIRRAVRA